MCILISTHHSTLYRNTEDGFNGWNHIMGSLCLLIPVGFPLLGLSPVVYSRVQLHSTIMNVIIHGMLNLLVLQATWQWLLHATLGRQDVQYRYNPLFHFWRAEHFPFFLSYQDHHFVPSKNSFTMHYMQPGRQSNQLIRVPGMAAKSQPTVCYICRYHEYSTRR